MTSDQDWEEYKTKFNKSYKDAQEEEMRRELYSKVKQRVVEHNKLYEDKEFTYSKDVCEYSDGNVCKAFKRTRIDRMPELPQFQYPYGTKY